MQRDAQSNPEPPDLAANLQRLWIEINQEGYGSSDLHEMRACFRSEWDEEHGPTLLFDPKTGAFGDWEE
jgi:hypothetical protein